MLTNLGLVDHAIMAFEQHWGYVRGTFGQVLSLQLYQYKLKQLGYEAVGQFEEFILENWLNKRTADCVGLIKSYLWWNGGNVIYSKETDVDANGMYSKASKKGSIASIPEIPGICVWKKGHIGVYLGNGFVIEARGTKAGVIKSPLTGTGSAGWTNWLECPFIKYVQPVVNLTYEQIIDQVSEQNASDWKNAIETAVNAATASGNLGSLEIFKWLPELIVKIYYHK